MKLLLILFTPSLKRRLSRVYSFRSKNTLHVEKAKGRQSVVRQTGCQSCASCHANSVVAETEDLETRTVAGAEGIAQQTNVGVCEAAVCW